MDLGYSSVWLSSNIAVWGCKETRVHYQGEKKYKPNIKKQTCTCIPLGLKGIRGVATFAGRNLCISWKKPWKHQQVCAGQIIAMDESALWGFWIPYHNIASERSCFPRQLFVACQFSLMIKSLDEGNKRFSFSGQTDEVQAPNTIFSLLL